MIAVDACRIQQHLVLHHRAAETGIVGHAMHRTISPRYYPVFNRLQFLRTAVRTLQYIAIHQAARAEQRCHARGNARRQCGLRKSFKNDLPGKVIVGAVFKGEPDVRQPVQRDRAHHHHVRNAVHLQFQWKSHEPLDFFGRMIRPLRDDFDLRRREVRIRVHRHALKRQHSADRDERGQHQHQESLTQRRLDDSMDHSRSGCHYP